MGCAEIGVSIREYTRKIQQIQQMKSHREPLYSKVFSAEKGEHFSSVLAVVPPLARSESLCTTAVSPPRDAQRGAYSAEMSLQAHWTLSILECAPHNVQTAWRACPVKPDGYFLSGW